MRIWEKIKKYVNFVSKDGNLMISLQNKGFTLWIKDDDRWHWIIDASLILQTKELDISNNKAGWTTELKRYRGGKHDNHARYLIQKKGVKQ